MVPSTSFIPPRFLLLVRRTIILRIESAFRVNPFTWKLFLTNEPWFSLFPRTTATVVIGPGYLLRGAEKLQIKVGHGTRERASTRATENARASGEKQASAEERSRRSKRFQSSYCAKARAKARGGEKRKVSFSPLHLPVHSSFLLSSQRSRRSPAETLATRRLERSDSPQMLAGYAFLSKARRCNKYTNKLVIFDARSMFATDGNMLKRFVAHLCYGSLKVPWME